MLANAERLMNDASRALQDFYNKNFSASQQQGLKIIVGYVYLYNWKNNQEIVWAEKLLNTSKSREGTSAENVCLELIPVLRGWLKEVLDKSSHEQLKTGYQAQLIINTLPEYLAVYYIACLNYDIINLRFSTTKNLDGKLKITKVNYEVS